MNFNRLIFSILILMFMLFSCKSQEKTNNINQYMKANKELINRQPCASGRFYSNDPNELRNDIKALFKNALPSNNNNNLMAIISPHAGYVFSGGVAATSFNQINNNKNYDNIFIIGSSHTASFTGASIYSKGNYITPLGEVKVNTILADKLINENSVFDFHPSVHKTEHSIEVQLPILQYHMKADYKIIPIIIGSQDKNACEKIAEALTPYFNENNLFIISTDFSHYPTYEQAIEIDNITAEAIKLNDTDELINVLSSNNNKGIDGLATSLCGWTSVLTLLYLTKNTPEVKYSLLQYKNSGDSPYGEKNGVVGYYSIICSKEKEKEKAEAKKSNEESFLLTKEDKKVLLNIARTTIKEYIKTGKKSKVDDNSLSQNLITQCGAFVSLHKNSDLRGCVGRFGSEQPLYLVVQDMAIAAATQDTRFSAVSIDELEYIDIEISVLTPLKEIKTIDDFELGKHGIYIKKGYSTGTFLPQVAEGAKWTKEEFFGHCARDKAHIGWNGWIDAELYTYEAIIFGENNSNH